MKLKYLFEKWTRFEDKLPKDKSTILVYDGFRDIRVYDFHLVPFSKTQYFFWIAGTRIPPSDDQDLFYPLWMKFPCTKYRTYFCKKVGKVISIK